jgi:hypothetical protein
VVAAIDVVYRTTVLEYNVLVSVAVRVLRTTEVVVMKDVAVDKKPVTVAMLKV